MLTYVSTLRFPSLHEAPKLPLYSPSAQQLPRHPELDLLLSDKKISQNFVPSCHIERKRNISHIRLLLGILHYRSE